MAIDGRRPLAGTLIHSDHGSQFASWTFANGRTAGLAHELGSVGDAFDNAVVESFWGRMQTELLDSRKWRTRTELSTEIFDWTDNRELYSRMARRQNMPEQAGTMNYRACCKCLSLTKGGVCVGRSHSS